MSHYVTLLSSWMLHKYGADVSEDVLPPSSKFVTKADLAYYVVRSSSKVS